jgi:thioredoxin reductase (NADPH)
MIRNHLGFPRGVTGRQLGRRAVIQAAGLGAAFDLGCAVTGLHAGAPHRLSLDDGAVAAAHTVVLACGVTYRRLGVPGLEDLVGRGVFYGAAATQARALQGQHAVVVGAGNSAGQAALHLARFAARVTICARGGSLTATMSDYLVRQIETDPRVTARTCVEVANGAGEGRLEWVQLVDRGTGEGERLATSGLFILIGPSPAPTGSLPSSNVTGSGSLSPESRSTPRGGRSIVLRSRSRRASPVASLRSTCAPVTGNGSPPLARDPSRSR